MRATWRCEIFSARSALRSAPPPEPRSRNDTGGDFPRDWPRKSPRGLDTIARCVSRILFRYTNVMKITITRGVVASLVLLTSSVATSAQTDFSGEWTVVRSMDNTENPWVGDWVGLPLNA